MPFAPLQQRPQPGWKCWLLNFSNAAPEPYPASVGLKIVASCLFLEGLARPVARAVFGSYIFAGYDVSRLALVSCMLALAVGLTAFWIRLPFSRIGLSGWRRWSDAEKWFFPQMMAVSALVFTLAEWNQLADLIHRPAPFAVALVFCEQMIWGFYQEYVYRGLLQTELVRRWGAIPGILASNLIFTFGPLHAYHFANAFEQPSRLLIFPGIFAIGLYFGVLFHRSGNLWIIGAAHGVGDFFVDGLARMKPS
jgi:membrane protease YdiL (CAAX protease family)